jgi:hypothetical protein
VTPALQSIPTLLRRSADLGDSTITPGAGNELDDLNGPAPTQAPLSGQASVLGSPELSSSDATPALQSIPALLQRPNLVTTGPAGENNLDDLGVPTSGTPGEQATTPPTYTLITRPPPSKLNEVLQQVIGMGSKVLGGSGGTASSGGTSSAASIADDGTDNTPGGSVTLPFAGQTSVLAGSDAGNNSYSGWNNAIPGGNELDDLTGPTTVSQVPSALSRLATSAVLMGSLAASPLAAAAQPSPGVLPPPSSVAPALQSIPQLLQRPDLGTSPATLTGENGLDDLAMPSSSSAAEGGTFTPPDVQPQTYTLITRPQPSLLGQILQGVIGVGTKAFGGSSLFGGSGAASSAGSAAGSAADDAADIIPDLTGLARGGRFNGMIRGAGTGTSDSINARLSHGEFVTRASSAVKHLSLLHAINEDRLPKFADGGSFGDLVSPSMAYVPAASDFAAMTRRSDQIAGSASSTPRAASGDTHHWNITTDARGSNDPAQLTAALDRHWRKNAPQLAALAIHATKDGQLRRPPSAR